MKIYLRRPIRFWTVIPSMLGLVALGLAFAPAAAGSASAASKARPFTLKPSHVAGNLDCNGYSTMQRTIMFPKACTDIRGSQLRTHNTWGGRFYDNGHYIGHDEPDMTFFSNRKGSGNSVNWTETLPKDPTALPTVNKPGHDVTHNFELTIAPWFGMDLCDGTSYPQLPCTPNRDANAPACFGPKCPVNTFPGGGSAFLEMQFYPPGDAPFIDSISCDNTHWCASLHINELMCTLNFVSCNPGCEETTNFAFVQRNGVPTGPPSPQLSDNATATPNSETLLMNPGDKLAIRIFDAPAPAVPKVGIPRGHALMVSIHDLTTGQSGFMQASAFNGFAQTDISSCNGRLFNYQPEYSTAKPQNIVPWAALQANISTEFEIGHFTPCTSVSGLAFNGPGGAGDPFFNNCTSPYEKASDASGAEGNDFPCFTNGDTHGTLASDPNEVAGCLNFSNDPDFDGTPYRVDWPTGTTVTAKTPSTFVQNMPTSHGSGYPSFLFQTDVALSETNCAPNGSGCSVPPTGPEVDQAGHTSFYPFWSVAKRHGQCLIEFGNNKLGVNTFGRDAQYGTVQIARLGYPEFEGKMHANVC